LLPVMDLVFLDRFEEPSRRIFGFRCVARCAHEPCGRWFFAFDDRQRSCSKQCRPSRQDERRPARAVPRATRRHKSA
jgi:hypothetical protein